MDGNCSPAVACDLWIYAVKTRTAADHKLTIGCSGSLTHTLVEASMALRWLERHSACSVGLQFAAVSPMPR